MTVNSREFKEEPADAISCTADCKDVLSFINNKGEKVCGALNAPAKEGVVGRFTLPNGMRKCVTKECNSS